MQKRIPLYVFCLILLGGSLAFISDIFIESEPTSHKPDQIFEPEPEKRDLKSKTEIHVQQSTGYSKETLITKQTSHYQRYVASLDKSESEQIVALQSFLFNLISDPSDVEFVSLIQQGFPQKAELDFAKTFNVNELSVLLFNNKTSDTKREDEQLLNVSALRVLSFVNSVREIEKTLGYFLPGFEFNVAEDAPDNWQITELPEQVNEVLVSLVYANSSLSNETGLELLAKAKFESMMHYWNRAQPQSSDRLFVYFAEASKLLPHLQIDEFVLATYPDHYLTYLANKQP